MPLSNLSLSKNDEALLNGLLKKYLKNADFYAFGSRAQGKAKKYSDLDIAYTLKGENNIFLLQDEICDSDISITVDFVNLNDISQDFMTLIKGHMIKLY
jgi:predicted nucleotidyltransferase